MIGKEEIDKRFGYHRGTSTTSPMHADLRKKFMELAVYLDVALPDGRAKSVMFTELENAAMWGNKAIAELAPLAVEA